LYHFSASSKVVAVLATIIVATLVEFISPMGSDDLFVPLLSVLTFPAFGRGA